MGGQPFFLGMDDTPEYLPGATAMRQVIRADDIPALAAKAEAMAEAIVAGAGGQLEVVDELVRQVTFDLFRDYFGVTDPPGGDLRVWATRLFEFQFADDGTEELRGRGRARSARRCAPISMPRSPAAKPRPTARTTCWPLPRACRRKGEPGYSDVEIRTGLMGMIVGGPPQPPMVVPQALEQLLRRPEALAGAQAAARANDDALPRRLCLRGDALRSARPGAAARRVEDGIIAAGTKRQTKVPKGAKVLVGFSSAMMDARRLEEPYEFRPGRLPHEYIHFGYGLHQCFGMHINQAMLPLMLKPLLKRPNLRRAGKLRKQGPFSVELKVRYD